MQARVSFDDTEATRKNLTMPMDPARYFKEGDLIPKKPTPLRGRAPKDAEAYKVVEVNILHITDLCGGWQRATSYIQTADGG